jgi:hypothetical protein
MPLTIAQIKTRFLNAFGAAQSATIQDAEMNKFATAYFTILTTRCVLTNIVAGIDPIPPGANPALGTLTAVQLQFFNALKAAFGAAQSATIQDSVLNAYAQGCVDVLNLDATSIYVGLSNGIYILPSGNTIPTGAAGILVDLQAAYGSSQNAAIQTTVLTAFSNGLYNALLTVTANTGTVNGTTSLPGAII